MSMFTAPAYEICKTGSRSYRGRAHYQVECGQVDGTVLQTFDYQDQHFTAHALLAHYSGNHITAAGNMSKYWAMPRNKTSNVRTQG